MEQFWCSSLLKLQRAVDLVSRDNIRGLCVFNSGEKLTRRW